MTVQGVTGSDGGLGYFGFSYYEQNQDKLNLVGVGEKRRQVLPSRRPRTIQNGTYTPFSRPLFMYPSAKALKRPEVQAFMDYVIDNYETIAEAAQIVPMTQEQADASKKELTKDEGASLGDGGLLTTTAAGARPVPALGAGRRRWGEEIIKALLILAALISVLTTTGIVIALLRETIDFFGSVGLWDFLSGGKWTPLFEPPSFGVRPLVIGTFLITFIALAVAAPLGLGAAIYLSEYARPRVRKTLKPILELLAGVPTIVFGYFALTFFTPNILQDLLHVKVDIFNALAAGIIMGFMVIPTVASVAEDAMSSVPQSLREGAYGLGASKLQVSLRIVFPAALSGIVAAIVLGVSRAVGETMIVLLASGQVANNSLDPREPHLSLASFIGSTAGGDTPTGSIEYKTIFAVGMLLFVITLIMNLISIRFVRKYRQVYE